MTPLENLRRRLEKNLHILSFLEENAVESYLALRYRDYTVDVIFRDKTFLIYSRTTPNQYFDKPDYQCTDLDSAFYRVYEILRGFICSAKVQS